MSRSGGIAELGRGYVIGVTDQAVPDAKRIRLRYAGVCRVCSMALPIKAEAIYERSSKTVRCVSHAAAAPAPAPLGQTTEEAIEAGVPGASTRREFDRRKARREAKIREQHPRIGGLLHALSDEPQTTTAWETGAVGEERLGSRLNELASDRLRVLHDRRIPGTRANIDHLVVTPTGIYVIDAKKYQGRPRLAVSGGFLRPRTEKLMVGTRDCDKLVDGVVRQVGVVTDVVSDRVPVHGVLCFVEADWPLVGGSFTTREVQVLWPKKFYPSLMADGPESTEDIDETHRLLASSLPPA